MKILIFRLKPNSDLKTSIKEIIDNNFIKAGYIITCVGSLKRATIRMAGAKPDSQNIQTFDSNYEITSLVGTLSTNGSHIHISFSDENGIVIGGHLKEGTIIDTTAEIVIGIDDAIEINREIDPETGFKELAIKIKNDN